MKPIAIFDIDGTIFRSSLTIELFERLVKQGVIEESFLRRIRRSERKWLDRQGHYDNYINEVVAAYQKAVVGKRQKDVLSASREIIEEQKYRTYRYTRDLLQRLRGRYVTIGISGSPLEVVEEYNRYLEFDKLYGSEFGVDERGRYTGAVLHEPPKYKKEVILRYVKNHNLSFKNSIGIGDTESDIGFLELVERPIAFNPNVKLAQKARREKWLMVIERKDLIVQFDPNLVNFIHV